MRSMNVTMYLSPIVIHKKIPINRLIMKNKLLHKLMKSQNSYVYFLSISLDFKAF